MYLYHVTSMDNMESIKREGLVAKIKNSDTFAMGEVINNFTEHPNYIERNNCLFFRIDEPYFIEEEEVVIMVDSNSLDFSNLFVCDEELADKIYHSKKNSAKRYLNKVVQFNQYCKDMERYEDDFEKIEIMHLGNIPKEKINFI